MTLQPWQDLRTSLRGIRRRPLHPLIALSILTVGLAASVAVFTYFNGFYQPFPGADDRGLVRLFGVESEEPFQDISFLDFLDYRDAVESFEGLAAVQPYYAASVRLESMTEVAYLEAVTGDYFGVLGVGTSLGRGLVPADDRPEAEPAAVISHGWWLRLFDGSPSVIGSVIYLNYRPFTVVGVAEPGFLGSTSDTRPDVWIPIAPFRDRYTSWAAMAEDRDTPLVRVYGRLVDGTSRPRSLAELGRVALGLDETFPSRTEARGLRLEPATWIDPRTRLTEMPTVQLMMAAAGGLLLLTCANVASLMLALAAGRRNELALRAAVGAPPGRILRLVLTENMLLAAIAGGLALALAGPLSARLGSYFARPSVWAADIPREVSVDLRVVAFTLAISLVTGLAAGALPALEVYRRDLVGSLKTDTVLTLATPRKIGPTRVPGVHDLLVAFQVALAIVLLVVAGLVLRTLVAVRGLDPGFAHERLVASYISTSSTSVEKEGRQKFFKELTERLTEESWVVAATIADRAPLSGQASAELRLDGRSEPVSLLYSRVNPGFFATLEIDLLRGRAFSWRDLTDAPLVAVVNEALAERFFGGSEAVGRRIWWPSTGEGEEREFEIVGVVRSAKPQDIVAEPPPMVYFSYPQLGYPSGSSLLVSTVIEPAPSIPMLYRWLRDLEPHLAIVNALPYTEVVRGLLYAHRMNAEMFSALAFLGLALAAAGIFSVVNLAVGRRTREIGVRMALGARRDSIGRFVVRRAMTPVVIGLVAGLAASFPVSRLVGSLLYGIEPGDPLTLAAGATVLIVAALAAAWPPALRAATQDPAAALR